MSCTETTEAAGSFSRLYLFTANKIFVFIRSSVYTYTFVRVVICSWSNNYKTTAKRFVELIENTLARCDRDGQIRVRHYSNKVLVLQTYTNIIFCTHKYHHVLFYCILDIFILPSRILVSIRPLLFRLVPFKCTTCAITTEIKLQLIQNDKT